MELTEISDRIDILLNSFEIPIEVDEYEKSIYLTMAQRQVHKELCDAFEIDGGVGNWLQPYIALFITDYPVQFVVRQNMVEKAVNVVIPGDVYKIVQERAFLNSSSPVYYNKEVKVLKTRMHELLYKIDNPFREPNKDEILRVTTSNTDTQDIIQLVLPENTELLRYQCSYVRIAQPIILEALPDGLTIDEESGPLNTLFDDDILEKIIDLAVMFIKRDKTVVNQQNV
jgi:hypothetical protein